MTPHVFPPRDKPPLLRGSTVTLATFALYLTAIVILALAGKHDEAMALIQAIPYAGGSGG